jgi:hypothetical protein
MTVPKIRQGGAPASAGAADLAAILAELERLRDAAEAAGYDSLEYLIACAANEARWLADRRSQGDEGPAVPPRT